MQKGAQKLTATAATFSERVKAEIAIARLRIRMDEVQARIDGLHRDIGKVIAELSKREELPKATEQLMKREDIVAALGELAGREKEMEDLHAEVRAEQDAFKQEPKQGEGTAA